MRKSVYVMSSQNPSAPPPIDAEPLQAVDEQRNTSLSPADKEHSGVGSAGLTPFWQDRLFEGALILSMGLYYTVANPNLYFGIFPNANPLYSLPFLLIFAVLCWYRLPFAIALLPLALPYYYLQKVVFSHYVFSLAEVTLGVCVAVAIARLIFKPEDRHFLLSWREVRDRLGPFLWPIVVFVLAAAISITIAYEKDYAIRAFREEVFDPLIYVALIFMYLRTRKDVLRLLGAFLGCGLVIALLGLAQFIFFRYTLVVESDGIQRVHAVYGSANNVALLFDYVLPLAMAWLLGKVPWKSRLLALVLIVSMGVVIDLTSSRGSWMVAIPIAAVFVIACAIPNRKLLLGGGLVCVAVLALVLGMFHAQLWHYVVDGHVGSDGHSTALERPFLWLTAWHMIHASPWLGYGMDNWLCHFSVNTICPSHLPTYMISTWHGKPTGLADEPTLSHPHNNFLHVWVSMGIFGLLAFVALLVLFYWLFARILRYLDTSDVNNKAQWRWMVVGVGAAMLAAMAQGQIDSSFLEQDLAFCFWILVALLLLLRLHSQTPWRGKISSKSQ
jgi:putative inorganic carbon (HCO3(-)) transporter